MRFKAHKIRLNASRFPARNVRYMMIAFVRRTAE